MFLLIYCLYKKKNIYFFFLCIRSLRSKSETVVGRMPALYKENAQQLVFRRLQPLRWNYPFLKELKIGVTPFLSIGLGRRATQLKVLTLNYFERI